MTLQEQSILLISVRKINLLKINISFWSTGNHLKIMTSLSHIIWSVFLDERVACHRCDSTHVVVVATHPDVTFISPRGAPAEI